MNESVTEMCAAGVSRELVSRNDELGVGVATHAVNGAGRASAHGIRVATWMLGDDGDGSIGAAHDRPFVIEGIRAAEVDDEACVLRTAHEGDGGSDFNAEGFVLLGVGDARFCGCVGTLAAPDVDGAGRRSGAACVGGCTNAGGIGSGANVALDFLLGVAASDEVGQQKRQHEQTTESYKIAISLH
jgi:hypothetical protein